MKGIVLAGGNGTRLYPATLGVSKQMLPVYDKPMIYYPISILMLANIKDILIISSPSHLPIFKNMLGDGSNFGVNFSYEVQNEPKGIAEAFLIGETFLDEDSCCLALGDNILYGSHMIDTVNRFSQLTSGAGAFGFYVKDPSRYGVIEFGDKGNAISIEEKPKCPKSNYAIPGLYFFDSKASSIAKTIKPSDRGELEITSMLEYYLKNDALSIEKLRRGTVWLDSGLHESLYEASVFVKTIEDRQGLKIACLEEIAYHNGWVDKIHLLLEAKKYKNQYGEYLTEIANRGHNYV